MFTSNEMIDGIICLLRFTRHFSERSVSRPVGDYNDIIKDITLAGEYLLEQKEGEQVNIINCESKRTTCVLVKTDEDYNIQIIVKTVIDSCYINIKRNNYILGGNNNE